ncbi:MAG: CopG family transcriptional regulator [Burkholderiaceae bacterium]
MRTTIRLDDQLLAAAKRRVLESGRTLTVVLEDALREARARRSEGSARKRVRLITVKGTGLRPGIDLDDASSLQDAMDA